MSVERDLVRWLDASDCDPALRAALDHARRSAPVGAHAEALARAIEQAVNKSAAESGAALHGKRALRLSFGLSGVGVAAALLYFGATWEWDRPAVLAPRVGEPVESSTSAAVAHKRGAQQTAPLTPQPAAEPAPAPPELHAALDRPASVSEATDSQSARAVQPRAARAATGRARTVNARASAARSASSSRETTPPAELARAAEALRPPDTAAPEQSDVPSELQLLAAAQRALRVSPSKALEFTDEHARAYPAGKFAAEREEIAIAALVALGDNERARARARAFLGRYPHSLSRPRVERMLEQAH